MKKRLFFLLFLIPGCIEPYLVVAPESESMLNVEGFITDFPGPHVIKISRTATYGSVFVDFIRPVSQAIVAVRENETGLVTFLKETDQGMYETPTIFEAKIGNTYSLKITTREGIEYTSFPSKTHQAPQLDSMVYSTLVIPTENRLLPRSGLRLLAYFKDPSDEKNFYFWNVKNPIAKVETFPEFFKPRFSLPSDPYQPKECCKYCDVPDVNLFNSLYIADDSDFNGLVTNQIAGFLEDNGFRFSYKYQFEFEQMAISEETFRFLKLVNQQLTISGSVFDPPPANIRGNLVCLTHPEETVLGHFFSAGVSKTSILLNREDLDLIQIQRAFNDDCRLLNQPVPPSNVDP